MLETNYFAMYNKMLRKLVLFLLFQVAISVESPTVVDTAHGTLTLEGRQKQGTDANIAGSFRSLEGDGIRFHSTLDSLEVTTMDGQSLVKVFRPSADVKANVEAKATAFQFLDEAYMEANRRTYRVPAENIATAKGFTPSQFLSNAQARELNDPLIEVQATVDRLVAHPAVRLLEPAARALGQELGIIGKEEPAAMAFYTAAMTLTEAYNKNRRAMVSRVRKSNPWDTYTSRRAKGKFPDCDLGTCPPCQEDECFGLCGYGCTCWAFVCGDCCYHLGCKDHDICCRDSFYSVSCLLPVPYFWFSCDKPYEC
jgi:hypothetical protein